MCCRYRVFDCFFFFAAVVQDTARPVTSCPLVSLMLYSTPELSAHQQSQPIVPLHRDPAQRVIALLGQSPGGGLISQVEVSGASPWRSERGELIIDQSLQSENGAGGLPFFCPSYSSTFPLHCIVMSSNIASVVGYEWHVELLGRVTHTAKSPRHVRVRLLSFLSSSRYQVCRRTRNLQRRSSKPCRVQLSDR